MLPMPSNMGDQHDVEEDMQDNDHETVIRDGGKSIDTGSYVEENVLDNDDGDRKRN
jgi:hypothetical protein